MLVNFRPSESRVLTRRPDISISEWSEQNVVIKKSSMPGPFRNRVQPFLAGIMDAFGTPSVREVVLCKGVQTGGTTAAYNCLFHESEASSDTALLVMADEKTVKGRMKQHVIPTYQDSDTLRVLLSSNLDDTSLYSIRLAHGFNIKTGWGTSTASLASDPCRVVILDEIDKYQSRQNIEEAKDRTTTYRRAGTSKVFALSTPGLEDGPVWQELNSCDEIRDYHVICPSCGVRQTMEWEFFRWPEGASHKAIRRRMLAWYQCPHCDAKWGDSERDMAVTAGEWIPRVAAVRATKIGFHLPSWLSSFVMISDVVAERLEADELAKLGDDAKLHHWTNNRAAMPYKRAVTGQIEEAHVLKFRSDLPRNLVPPDTARLALHVDTQQASFYYKVFAYGYAPEVKPHMIRHGIVPNFSDLEGLIAGTADDGKFTDHAGREFRIAGGLIDSGGTKRGYQKHSRTYEVYEWCSKNRVMIPIKGIPGRNGDILSYKEMATFPGTNKKIPGGLKRVNVRVDLFKDELERRLNCEPDDPQAMSYHSDIDEAYAKHYTGETKDENGDWQHSKRSQRIDYWDIDAYALAYREMIKLSVPKKEQTQAVRRVLSRGVRNE